MAGGWCLEKWHNNFVTDPSDNNKDHSFSSSSSVGQSVADFIFTPPPPDGKCGKHFPLLLKEKCLLLRMHVEMKSATDCPTKDTFPLKVAENVFHIFHGVGGGVKIHYYI